jgi:undecaprenyl diphosphate synthase
LQYKVICRYCGFSAAEKETNMAVQQVILQHILTAPPVKPEPSLHVAIITDGNGRWATSRGLPRSAGHRAGAEASRAIIEAAPKLGIHTLTLFALSSANWKRPPSEVNAILRLLHEYLMAETTHCMENGVRISVLGRRDRIPMTLRQAIMDAEAATAGGKQLHLRLAIDYSAREAIYLAACKYYKVTELSPESFGSVLSEVMRGGATDVDLLIRTGGEQRLSDFLLWECAFAEFVFLEKRWPDFTVADLRAALDEFSRRERTRGSLPQDIAAQSF